ncbi:hypothetical protein GCM10007103_05570 [Salinimicrobium marinum]|uniref:DUF5666 domain-containing protein n=2 Tax=Salinimicrobium marinum TaxID=680283 RepID=A0A918S6P5_9FLAO|nr:hypothetical protein GCM10007103_05570 [Salinimicrobium marinum]
MRMRKSILIFAAGFSLFSLTIGCKNSEKNNQDAENVVENVNETGADAVKTIESDVKELEDTDVVESGTYTGTAEVVDAEQKEIYVRLDNNKTIELYFSNDTELIQNGESVSFDAMERGQRVEVEVEKVNDQLNPQRVTILE